MVEVVKCPVGVLFGRICNLSTYNIDLHDRSLIEFAIDRCPGWKTLSIRIAPLAEIGIE